MKTIFGLANYRKELKGSVIAMGVFDGLHCGHRYLIESAVYSARRLRKKAVCITFHPHPQGLPYLVSLEHRLRLIQELGVDYCVVIPFNSRFANIKAEDFIENTLAKRIGPSYIFVGDKFRFGRWARGDVGFLKSSEKKYGFKVMAINELRIGRRIISSNLIRSLIRQGDLRRAQRFLGRRVSVLGTVMPGSGRGRLLGIKTANVDPHHEVLPREGVYAVKVTYPLKCYGYNKAIRESGFYNKIDKPKCPKPKEKVRVYDGICNIGRRPTFDVFVSRSRQAAARKEQIDKNAELVVEAHLLNFKKDIYGEDIEIQFVVRLRGEKRFSSETDLLVQIKKDRKAALKILERSVI